MANRDAKTPFEERWAPAFHRDTWWDDIVHTWRATDWEFLPSALDGLVYSLAKARGADGVIQRCPGRRGEPPHEVDQANTLDDLCDACEADEGRQHQWMVQAQRLRQVEDQIWLGTLSRTERARVLEERRRMYQAAVGGLMMRDVQ